MSDHHTQTQRLPAGVRLLTDPLTAIAGDRHVVLLIDQFSTVLGGGERMVLQTARLLRAEGYRVSIITLSIIGECPALDDPPCPVYLLPMTTVFGFGALRSAWQLGRFFRRERVAIVQTYFESSNLFGGLVTRLLSRARLVWNRRDMGILRDRKHRLVYPWLRWMPHLVMAVSEEVKQHAIAVDRIPPERVTVIYNGLSLERFSRNSPENSGHDPARPVVVTVGNIRPVKGHDVLLEAIAQIRPHLPGIQVVIAGAALDADWFAQLQRRASEEDLRGAVQFAGSVSDLATLFRGADIFALPSRSEGFSNSIVEAMAAGLPVVATKVGGNGEAVIEGVTGRLVPAESPKALAGALFDLLQGEDLRISMGRAGRDRVSRFFTESAMQRHLVEAFKTVSK